MPAISATMPSPPPAPATRERDRVRGFFARRTVGTVGRQMSALAAPLALFLAFAAPAAADYYNAVTAYERGEFATARGELEPLAAAGDPRAQLLLGRMYADGKGVVQDYVRAHQLLNLAAAAGLEGASAARDELAARMTPDQVAEAQRLAAAAAATDGAATPPEDDAQIAAVAAPAPAPTEPPPLDRQGLVDLQWQLALHGYDPGSADGTAGPRTTAAIRHYQADAGLPVDGLPSQALLDHIQFTVPAVLNAAAPARPGPTQAASRPATPGPLDSLGTGTKRAYVIGIQQALVARGYDPGPVDGVAGRRTRTAIRKYQADAGLPVDGQPSPALLNHLKFVGGRVAVVS